MRPMLASKWCDKNETMFPFLAQPKLDGIRVLVGEDGYLYTRSLKPIRNEALQSLIRRTPNLIGLDGEIIVGETTAKDCYRRTSSAVMSFINDDIFNAKFHVFDIWDKPFKVYYERYDEIKNRSLNFPDWVKLVSSTCVDSMKTLDYYETNLLEQGHEGVILRRGDARYKAGRGTPKKGELIKLKRFVDMEAKIIAVHEEMHNANPTTISVLGYKEHSGHQENLIGKETLGAVEVELDKQKWPSGSVRIGTGFNASDRLSLWAERDKLIGKWVKFKYFEIGVKDAPRFPVFLGFRDVDDMQGDLF